MDDLQEGYTDDSAFDTRMHEYHHGQASDGSTLQHHNGPEENDQDHHHPAHHHSVHHSAAGSAVPSPGTSDQIDVVQQQAHQQQHHQHHIEGHEDDSNVPHEYLTGAHEEAMVDDDEVIVDEDLIPEEEIPDGGATSFSNVAQGLEGKHRDSMLQYWQDTINSIEHDDHKFKIHQLPLARIKKVMKADEDVRMISAEAPILFAKGCDIFITELTMRAWIHAEENKRRTLQRSDIANALQKSDMFDFLIDVVPREEAISSKQRPGSGGVSGMGGGAYNEDDTQMLHPQDDQQEASSSHLAEHVSIGHAAGGSGTSHQNIQQHPGAAGPSIVGAVGDEGPSTSNGAVSIDAHGVKVDTASAEQHQPQGHPQQSMGQDYVYQYGDVDYSNGYRQY